jgi:hypothetical protein
VSIIENRIISLFIHGPFPTSSDTAVGYQFVNVLYRGRRGGHKADLNLLNDVTEQNGGGGEPLNVHNISSGRFGDDAV